MDEQILLVVGFCITLIFVGGAFIHGVTQQKGAESEVDRDDS